MEYYVILGVAPAATLNDLKRAYRRLARRYHPDVNPGDAQANARYQEVTRAFETLADPDRRRRYDRGDQDATPPATPAGVGFAGFDFAPTQHGDESSFGDLFGDVLRRGGDDRTDRRPERGADLHAPVSLSFDEALRGARRSVTVTRLEPCARCRGAGRRQTPETVCERCRGTGVLRARRGHMVFQQPCAACEGRGRLDRVACGACNGQGVAAHSETVSAQIPPGVIDGARIRAAGKGHAGRWGGPVGDLLLTVSVEPHAIYRREGDDLVLVAPVAVHEAALGARIDVPSPDGPLRMRVPPGTQTGRRFRVSARGAPSLHTGRRGDLVVEIRVMLPSIIDERSKDLLRAFAALQTENIRQAFEPFLAERAAD